MIYDDAVSRIASNAAVVQAHSKSKQGAPVQPGPALLRSVAESGLDTALSELLADDAIGRKLLNDGLTISATDVSDGVWTVPKYVARILNIRCGSDSRRLRPFDSVTDFRDWYDTNYGSATISDTHPPAAYYPSGRSAKNEVKITFSPGIGTETSLYADYERNVDPINALAMFPSLLHALIVLGGVHHASGLQFDTQWSRAMSMIARRLDTVAGGPSRMRKTPELRRMVHRCNQLVSGSPSVSSAYVKGLT